MSRPTPQDAVKVLGDLATLLEAGRKRQAYPEDLLGNALALMNLSTPALLEWTLFTLGRIYREHA